MGAGITGLSTAYHLSKLGVKKVAVFSLPHTKSNTEQAPGYIRGGTKDNFTRISNAYGRPFAQVLWEFGDLAFDKLHDYAKQERIATKFNSSIRLITSTHELEEAQQAVKQMNECGIKSQVEILDRSHREQLNLNEQTIAIQKDGPRGSSINVEQLMTSLISNTNAQHIEAEVTEVRATNSSIKVKTKTKELGVYTGELVVLACHQNIADFLPSLKEAIIPVSDQWIEVKTTTQAIKSIISCNYGHEWGFVKESSMIWGGARYLRHHAGIGTCQLSPLANISEFLAQNYASLFKQKKPETKLTTKGFGASFDIYPCDELPIVGPMFGESRVLLATGYMGQGLSLGFMAGKCLAELISSGYSLELPRQLWPERLRSLQN